MDSISFKTKKLYAVYIKKWVTFCVEKNLNYKNPSLNNVALFLSVLYKRGLSYSAINIARSAISFFTPSSEGLKLGANPIISRIMLGIKNNRPKVSRYVAMWDIDIVLSFLRELWPLKSLPTNLVVKKLVTLILLVTSHRIQTLQTLKVSNLLWVRKDLCIFVLDEKLKHSRGKELGFVQLNAFDKDPRLCVIRCLREYLQRTKKDRGEIDYLLITTIRPFRPAKHDTIGNWVTNTLKDSGIDVSVFKPHSTRGASVSKYVSLKVPVDLILSKGQWSVESTFRKFYDKQILPQGDISQKLLNNFVKNNQK